MKLLQLQKEFAAYLYDQKKNKIFNVIENGTVPIDKRLKIYHNNVFGNFDNVLEMIYPKIKKLVGDNYFDYLTKIYHQKYRSPSGNLDDYGQHFPKIISSLKKEHKLLYLQDVAKLEWLYHITYFAKDAGPIKLEKLQNLKAKEYYKLKFKLHPSCYLKASQYPIYSIWNGLKKKRIIKSAEYVLIERCRIKRNVHNLSLIEFHFLEKIKKKNNIYQIYKSLSKNNPEFDIGALINKHIANGVLVEFSY